MGNRSRIGRAINQLGDSHVGRTIRWRWLSRALAPKLSRGAPDVLDAGSGNGLFAFRLARRFPSVRIHGIELDPAQVEACRSRLESAGLANLSFARGDLTEAQGEEAYDVVYSVDVMEHIGDDAAAIARLGRALRPGGRLFIHTPLAPQRHWLRRFDLERCPRADHVRPGYTVAELERKIRAAGLEPVSARYTHGAWGTLAWELWMLARRSGLTRLVLRPLLGLLVALEVARRPRRGNCILIEARRPDSQNPESQNPELHTSEA